MSPPAACWGTFEAALHEGLVFWLILMGLVSEVGGNNGSAALHRGTVEIKMSHSNGYCTTVIIRVFYEINENLKGYQE